MAFVIWRRNDEWVDASVNYLPSNYITPQGKEIKFEQLAVFEEWDAATVDFITAERNKLR